jgi:hypothetical protein
MVRIDRTIFRRTVLDQVARTSRAMTSLAMQPDRKNSLALILPRG